MRIAFKKELSRLPTVIPATDCTALLKVLSTLVLQPPQPCPLELPSFPRTLTKTTSPSLFVPSRLPLLRLPLSTTLSLLFLDTFLTISAWSTKSETTSKPTTNATMRNGDGSAARTVVRNATSSFPTTSLNAVSAVFVLAGAAVATDCELPACYYQSSIAAGGGLELLASFRIISCLEWTTTYLQRFD